VERARAGKALPDELSGSTFTITNLGMYEIDAFTPIINLPEAAILGVGRIKARPAAADGTVCVRQTMWLSLTFDHRLVDGAPAARFLQPVARLTTARPVLAAPLTLLRHIPIRPATGQESGEVEHTHLAQDGNVSRLGQRAKVEARTCSCCTHDRTFDTLDYY